MSQVLKTTSKERLFHFLANWVLHHLFLLRHSEMHIKEQEDGNWSKRFLLWPTCGPFVRWDKKNPLQKEKKRKKTHPEWHDTLCSGTEKKKKKTCTFALKHQAGSEHLCPTSFFLLAAFKPGKKKKRGGGAFSINSEMIDAPDAEITEWEGSVWGNDGLKRCEQNGEQRGFFLC